MQPDRIAAIRSLLDAATPGPWYAEGSDPWCLYGGPRPAPQINPISNLPWHNHGPLIIICYDDVEPSPNDVALITAAPSIIAELIDAYTQADAERAAIIDAFNQRES